MVKTPSEQFLYGILHVASVAHCILGGSPSRGIFGSVLGRIFTPLFGPLFALLFTAVFSVGHLAVDCVPVYLSDHPEPLLKVLGVSVSRLRFL